MFFADSSALLAPTGRCITGVGLKAEAAAEGSSGSSSTRFKKAMKLVGQCENALSKNVMGKVPLKMFILL